MPRSLCLTTLTAPTTTVHSSHRRQARSAKNSDGARSRSRSQSPSPKPGQKHHNRARLQARSTTNRPEAPQTARVETKLFSNVALGVPCDLPELARTSRPHVQGKRKLRRHATTSQNELSRYQNSNGLWWMFREPSPWDSQSEAAWQWGWSGGDFSNWGDDY